jgi:hypothetical protein
MEQVNYTALKQPVTTGMITLYKQSYGHNANIDVAVLAQFIVCMTIAAGLGMFGIILLAHAGNDAAASGIILLIFGLALAGIAWGIRYYNARLMNDRACYYQFAKDNGLHYWPATANPSHTGMMFGLGDTRVAHHQFFTTKGRIFEFGNHTYMTGSGKSRSSHQLGYISIYLDRNLPNMVLDSKANNASIFGANLSNLPFAFDKDQILKLEGDFNNYFTLYAPKDYETDALYVFAPDLMALMIDKVSNFDAEIIDNRLYVYSMTPFDFKNIAIMDRLLGIVTVVAGKTARQTAMYKDSRAVQTTEPAGVVASGGQRLKHGTSWAAIIVVIGIFGFVIVNIIWTSSR